MQEQMTLKRAAKILFWTAVRDLSKVVEKVLSKQ